LIEVQAQGRGRPYTTTQTPQLNHQVVQRAEKKRDWAEHRLQQEEEESNKMRRKVAQAPPPISLISPDFT